MGNENSLLLLYIVFVVSIIILLVAGVIYAAFVIPLQYKESKVKNGLTTLRHQMLTKGILALSVIVIAIFCLSARFIISDLPTLRYIMFIAILVFCFGLLGKAIIDYQIYHQQFSPKSKALHEKIDKLEKKGK